MSSDPNEFDLVHDDEFPQKEANKIDDKIQDPVVDSITLAPPVIIKKRKVQRNGFGLPLHPF